ncbi:MAG TPA: hypothetical protein VJH03_04525 [Blastocatellia bacterium]|nr:hypothetical protein [Blastocatellia bacterium]
MRQLTGFSSSPFSRSLRSLNADSFRRGLIVSAVAASLFIAWLYWFFNARVALYSVTDTARIEVEQAVFPVQAIVGGRVIAVHTTIGRQVDAGDLLIEIDTGTDRMQLEEEHRRRNAMASQLASIRSEITSQQQSLEDSRLATRAALEEARARYQEAEASARFAAQQAERIRRLHAAGLVSEVDLSRANAEDQQRQSAASALRLAAVRLENDARVKESDQQARIERLRRDVALLEGAISTVEQHTLLDGEEPLGGLAANRMLGRLAVIVLCRDGWGVFDCTSQAVPRRLSE